MAQAVSALIVSWASARERFDDLFALATRRIHETGIEYGSRPRPHLEIDVSIAN